MQPVGSRASSGGTSCRESGTAAASPPGAPTHIFSHTLKANNLAALVSLPGFTLCGPAFAATEPTASRWEQLLQAGWRLLCRGCTRVEWRGAACGQGKWG